MTDFILSEKDLRRFWDKVQIGQGCWLWIASKNSAGYGTFYLNGKKVGASILSYALHYGDYDNQKIVCHECGNRACVRPDHLRLDTFYYKMRDLRAKKRIKNQILTEKTVKAIKKILQKENNLTYANIGDQFGVCKSTIAMIASHKTWSGV